MSKDIDPFRERLRLLRKRWSEAVLQILGAEKGGILNAMLLGDKQQMDAEIKEQYQVNGIAHILAISGLHLSFVGLGFIVLCAEQVARIWREAWQGLHFC